MTDHGIVPERATALAAPTTGYPDTSSRPAEKPEAWTTAPLGSNATCHASSVRWPPTTCQAVTAVRPRYRSTCQSTEPTSTPMLPSSADVSSIAVAGSSCVPNAGAARAPASSKVQVNSGSSRTVSTGPPADPTTHEPSSATGLPTTPKAGASTPATWAPLMPALTRR